jgi:hypothetical protein
VMTEREKIIHRVELLKHVRTYLRTEHLYVICNIFRENILY